MSCALGGIRLPRLEIEQYTGAINLLLLLYILDTTTSLLLKEMIGYIQIELRLDRPLFSIPYYIYHELATDS